MSPVESLQITPQMIGDYLAVLAKEGKSKRNTSNRSWHITRLV